MASSYGTNASVAQLVERMPEEHGVVGSTPARSTNKGSVGWRQFYVAVNHTLRLRWFESNHSY